MVSVHRLLVEINIACTKSRPEINHQMVNLYWETIYPSQTNKYTQTDITQIRNIKPGLMKLHMGLWVGL